MGVMLKKVIVDSHPSPDLHQKLITSSGSPRVVDVGYCDLEFWNLNLTVSHTIIVNLLLIFTTKY